MVHYDDDLNIDAGLKVADQIESGVPNVSLSPFLIISEVLNLHLNADFLDGYHASAFPRKAENAVVTGNWNFTEAPTITNPGVNPNSVATYAQVNGLVPSGTPGRFPYFVTSSTFGSSNIRYDNSTGWLGVGIDPIAPLHVAGNIVSTGQIVTQLIGYAPFYVASNIKVDTLNVDMLDDQHGAYYLSRGNHTGFQDISTVTGLQAALDSKINLLTGIPGRVPYFDTPTSVSSSNIQYDPSTGFFGVGIYPLSPLHVQGNANITGQLAIGITGYAPMVVLSSLKVLGLNSDLLDDQEGSYYLDRANHTGAQAISTVTGLQTALNGKAGLSAGSTNRITYFVNSTDLGFTGIQYEAANGFVGVGIYPGAPLHVNGNTLIEGQISINITGYAPLYVVSGIKVETLNVDYLDDQHGAYYLDYNNFTNKPTIPSLTGYALESWTSTYFYSKIDTDLKYALKATSLSINGVGYDLSTNRSWSVGTVTGSGSPGRVPYFQSNTNLAESGIRYASDSGWIGFGVDPVAPVHFHGNALFDGQLVIGITGYAPIYVASSIKADNLNSDYLDDQHGSYYLDWNNFTNKPTIPSLSGYATESWTNTYFYSKIDADSRYSQLGHTHSSGQITDFTSAVRGSISATGSISYNSSTGQFSYSGGGGTVTGSGTNQYFAIWNSGSNLTNAPMYYTGSEVTVAGSLGVTGLSAFRDTLHVWHDLKIGTTGRHGGLLIHSNSSATLASCAALEVKSSTKGLLGPRGTEAEMLAISNPEVALEFFVTSGTGLGKWCYYGPIAGWRILSTRLYADGGTPAAP